MYEWMTVYEAMTQVSHRPNILAYSYTGINLNALNSKILLNGGLYGVPCKCANVPLTTPMSPHLATVERFQQRNPQRSRKRSPMRSMPNI